MNVSKLTEKYFRYNEPIGYGSFSIIYKGYDTHSHNLIAIKQITKIIDKKYFNNEVDLMRNLDHPNILKLYDVVRKKNIIYLILEYCNYGDLSNYISSPDNSQNIKYCYEIFSGLEYLCKNNILHRDMKPHNILIHNGTVKISDFGFAKAFEKNELITTFCGSPLYMAPEIITNKEYNSKSDIWSLGVIIYELFCKTHPYYTNSKNLLWDKIKKGIVVDYKNVNSFITEILQKMLINDPETRIDWDELFKYNTYIKGLYTDSCDESRINEDMIFEMEDSEYNKSITHSLMIPRQKPSLMAYSIDYREFNKSSLYETEDYTIFSRSAPDMGKSYMENYINKKNIKDSIPILGSHPEVKSQISSILDKSFRTVKNIFNW